MNVVHELILDADRWHQEYNPTRRDCCVSRFFPFWFHLHDWKREGNEIVVTNRAVFRVSLPFGFTCASGVYFAK